MKLNFATVIIIMLFTIGMATYCYALIEEGISGAPYYMKLATAGALLTITATFGAIIAGWLGLLDK